MTEIPAGPILDYASPIARTPLRLASRSVISILASGNRAIITESLGGQSGAVAAILFTGLTVTLLGCGVLGSALHLHNWTDFYVALVVLILYLIYAGGTLALILAVIHTSWRRTVLRVSPQQIVLTFHSPLKKKAYEWPSQSVQHVHVVQALNQRRYEIAYHLQIEIRNQQVAQLFGGHEISELSEIARLIREKLEAEE
jgi:hypothetical protein